MNTNLISQIVNDAYDLTKEELQILIERLQEIEELEEDDE